MPNDWEPVSEEELSKLIRERDSLRAAIREAIEHANGREAEWGERAEECFAILEQALSKRWNRI